MSKTLILIRGQDGNARYFGKVSGKLKIVANDTNGMPGGYHINARDGQTTKATWYRNPMKVLIFDEGNPNPIPFSGQLPDAIVVAADGKTLVRAVQVGILAGPMVGQIMKDGLYSRKTLMQLDWRILAGIGAAVIALGYIGGTTFGKFW